jgi:UDP-N-acetylglucosamine:LPS N-acetylglucosamine transferase
VESAGLASCRQDSVEILFAAKPKEYFRRFENCLADTDILWTKPSELIFYAALGLPVLLAPPVGGQEHANRDWLLSNKAALDCGDSLAIDRRLEHLLATGELCRSAWNAYSRLDRNGSDRICKIMESIGSIKPDQHRPPDSWTGIKKL